jgi:tRNA threonylcarbamoyladenosine biosynthesis protein TsaB
MSRILNIETSTTVCSVSISENGACKCFRENFNGNNHSDLIGVFVQEVLAEAGFQPKDLDAVGLSIGPGSYTGLRIGTSFAKGLCYGSNLKLITIPTLKIIAQNAKEKYNIEDNALLCPMIDARRMEVYNCIYDANLNQVRETRPEIIDENSFADILKEKKVYFFGNGAEKCKSFITHENAIFLDEVFPLATSMVTLSEEAFASEDFADVAYFEPFYLKAAHVTKPKNQLTPNS